MAFRHSFDSGNLHDRNLHDSNLQERQIDILFKKEYEMEEQIEELRNDYGNLYETTSHQYDELINDIHGIHKRFNSLNTDELKDIMKSYYSHAVKMDMKMDTIDYYVWLHFIFIYFVLVCMFIYVFCK